VKGCLPEDSSKQGCRGLVGRWFV